MRRGRGFNAREVANLRSWGVEPRPDEIEPEVVAPPPFFSRYEAMTGSIKEQALRAIGARTRTARSAAELLADERRRQADIERQMGLRPR